MKRYTTSCDMGSIKVFNRDMSVFFLNGIGDLPTTVDVYAKPRRKYNPPKGEYLGHFTVKEQPAFLSSYDCDDDAIHEFGRGRWFVTRVSETHMRIDKVDEDLHA